MKDANGLELKDGDPIYVSGLCGRRLSDETLAAGFSIEKQFPPERVYRADSMVALSEEERALILAIVEPFARNARGGAYAELEERCASLASRLAPKQ